MLVGNFRHTLDSKKRIFIPAKFREELGEKIVIAKSRVQCLKIYTEEAWTELAMKMKENPGDETGELRRFLFLSAIEVQPDAQGRVVLSQELCDYAGLKKTAVIIGMFDKCEIWDEDILEERNQKQAELINLNSHYAKTLDI